MNNNELKLSNLERQFGKRLVATAIQSKTFVSALRRIRNEQVKIRQVGGPCRAYYDRRTRTIYIGSRCSHNYKIISIVHEFVHAVVSPTFDPIPGATGRQEFIDSCIGDETEAIALEVQCVDELLKAGIYIQESELKWLRLYKKGGRRAIRKELQTTITSTTGEDYPTYYGESYDEIVPEHLRLP